MDTHDLQYLQDLIPQAPVDEGVRRRAAEEFGLELNITQGTLCLSQRLAHRRGMQWGVASAALFIGAGLIFLPGYLPDLGIAGAAVRLTSFIFGFSLILLAVYLPFAAVDVAVSRRRIERVRKCWGIALKRRVIPAADVADLSIDPGRTGTIGQSYDLVGRGRFGKLKLVDDIPDREFLDRIRHQIMRSAGLRPSGTH